MPLKLRFCSSVWFLCAALLFLGPIYVQRAVLACISPPRLVISSSPPPFTCIFSPSRHKGDCWRCFYSRVKVPVWGRFYWQRWSYRICGSSPSRPRLWRDAELCDMYWLDNLFWVFFKQDGGSPRSSVVYGSIISYVEGVFKALGMSFEERQVWNTSSVRTSTR